MKILFALLLCASSAFAQEVIPLGAPVWYDARIDPARVAVEDGIYQELNIQSNKLPNIHWDLPKLDSSGEIVEPDSVVFIVSGAAEFYGFSTWNLGNLLTLGFTKEAGRVSFPYRKQRDKRAFRVGLAANIETREGNLNVGGKAIDAAYVVYLPKTEDTTLSVDPIESVIDVHQVQWYDVTGVPNFYGTRKELQRSGLKGWFFSVNGKYLILE